MEHGETKTSACPSQKSYAVGALFPGAADARLAPSGVRSTDCPAPSAPAPRVLRAPTLRTWSSRPEGHTVPGEVGRTLRPSAPGKLGEFREHMRTCRACLLCVYELCAVSEFLAWWATLCPPGSYSLVLPASALHQRVCAGLDPWAPGTAWGPRSVGPGIFPGHARRRHNSCCPRVTALPHMLSGENDLRESPRSPPPCRIK